MPERTWHPQGDSNPCRRRERAVSQADQTMGTPLNGEPDGDRTHDHLVKSQVLYRLSYRPVSRRDYSVRVQANRLFVKLFFENTNFFALVTVSINHSFTKTRQVPYINNSLNKSHKTTLIAISRRTSDLLLPEQFVDSLLLQPSCYNSWGRRTFCCLLLVQFLKLHHNSS